MYKVPQFIPYVGHDEWEAMETCFTSQWITEGPKTEEFTEALADKLGVKHVVLAPNGTLALYLGLRALGIGPGDGVIVPDFTMVASANAVEMTGATPVFVDVECEHCQIDVDRINILTGNVKAIMPVHMYGMAADMSKVCNYANKHNLFIIEDAAQAFGVTWDDKPCGSFGHIGCFSLFADKTITTGEGGFVCTNSDHGYEQLLYLRNQGRLNRGTFVHPHIGYNFRMTDMQSAMGLAQLAKLDEIIERKRQIMHIYMNSLRSVRQIKFTIQHYKSNYIPFRTSFTSEALASDVIKHLAKDGIEARTYFYPLHKQPCYHGQYAAEMGWDYDWNSMWLYEHGLCLPSFISITSEQIELVCKSLRSFYA